MRIKDFPVKTTASDSDLFIFDGSNGTSVISLSNLKTQIGTGNSGSSTSSGKDYIVQTGTSGEWYYRIWASGYKECFIPRKSVSKNIGSGGSVVFDLTPPISFTGASDPCGFCSARVEGDNTSHIKYQYIDKTEIQFYVFTSLTGSHNVSYNVLMVGY